MGDIRAPAVAGSFYPRNARELRAEVCRCIEQNRRTTATPPKAVIVPHAGYVYSGPIAGSAFSSLAPSRGRVTRVVLMGPAHRVSLSGLALPEADSFATPLGLMRVDREARAALFSLPQVTFSDEPHAGEHSLEVELPFVHEVLGDVPIVPIVVGDVTDTAAAEVLERVWGGPETVVVVSSDLSHYYPYSTARRLDQRTALAIEHLSPADIGEEQACGRVAIRALLMVAGARNLRARTLDLRNSGDTAGRREQVVGYGAFTLA
jgi:AmmeMemoRadiSam system protein B